MPFIAWWPGHIQGGQVNDHQLAFYDVMPTFCELVGDKKFPKKYLNKKLEGDCFDGISFAPTLLGQDERQAKHDFLYWEFHETDQIGLRMGDWKLVVVRGVPRLYDLATDIHEDHDVAAQHPDIVRQMTDIILREHRPSELFRVTLPSDAAQGFQALTSTYVDKDTTNHEQRKGCVKTKKEPTMGYSFSFLHTLMLHQGSLVPASALWTPLRCAYAGIKAY